MVSLRSGKRTARLSDSAKGTEESSSTIPATPRRRTKKADKVEEEPESITVTTEDPSDDLKVIDSQNSADSIETDDEKTETVEETTDSDEIVTIEDSGEEQEKEEEEEPMEIIENEEEKEEEADNSSKDEEDDDDDDMPEEITSKKDTTQNVDIELAPAPEPQLSGFEKVMAKKAAKSSHVEAKKADKRLKKKKSRQIARKVTDGVFEVKAKKNKTSFKVVTLKKGIDKILEPETNFREELLKARTSTCRVKDTQLFAQRAKWVSKRC